MDLASLLTGEDSTDHAGLAPSPSSALHALADITLDDTRPLASPPSLDLSGAGVGHAGVTKPVPLPLTLSPPPRPWTPGTVALGPTADACLCLPAPLRDVTPPAANTQTQLPVVPAVSEGTALDSTTPWGADGTSGGRPVAATASEPPELFGEDFDLPTWIDEDQPHRHSSTSSGDDSVFEPATMPTTNSATQPVPVRPVLTLGNWVTIARSSFGLGQAQLLVPSILDGFATELTGAQATERLQLLLLMRREVATLVCDIILLGQACREPPGVILLELLELAEQYTEDTQ